MLLLCVDIYSKYSYTFAHLVAVTLRHDLWKGTFVISAVSAVFIALGE